MAVKRNCSRFSGLLCLQDYKDIMEKEDQRQILLKKKLECIGLILSGRDKEIEGVHCNRTWDNILCWPPTKAGSLAYLQCPNYVSGLNPEGNATRMCMEDGTWYFNPEFNNTWSNLSGCIGAPTDKHTTVPELIQDHMVEMRLMFNIGYGLSMASLLTAVVIMLYFKKLHCPRNTIHLNLFMSFILRSAVSFVRENLLVEGLGFPGDVYYTSDNKLHFKKEGMHWECRLFFSIFNYIIAANYTWIFVEALYLQMLISVSVFSEKSRSKWYILFGWAFPLTFIIPWVCLRISTIGNEYCWNTYYNAPRLLWVIYGPITASIIVNFIIFLNIVRILFTKLNASPCPETKIFRYRRLAKSTLILIPLFGVYYIVFTISTIGIIKGKAMVVMMYAELFFNSYQGFLLSLLFCFFNSEVQAEIKKAWKRHRLRRGSSKSIKSTIFSHSRVTRHRHSDVINGDIKNNGKVTSYELKESVVFSDDEDMHKMNGVVKQDLSDLNEPIHCIDNRRMDGIHYNIDTLKGAIVEEQTPCLNNNHTSCDLELDHSNSEESKGR